MNIPDERSYSKTHEWVKFMDDTTVRIGLTDFAQEQLGDIVYINLPEAGEDFKEGDTLSDVESVKAVSDIIAPISGHISAVNTQVSDAPEMINETPYEAWFVEMNEIADFEDLMNAEEYTQFLEENA